MFKIGDVVYLKSGGPLMTVMRAKIGGSVIECCWFDGNTLRQDVFKVPMLKHKE